MIMEMIAAAEVREEDETYQSPLDELFERLEMRDPEHLAVKQYNIFKLAAGKTAKSILIGLGVRLEKFNLTSIAGMSTVDELDLPRMGTKKLPCLPSSPTTTAALTSSSACCTRSFFNRSCTKLITGMVGGCLRMFIL